MIRTGIEVICFHLHKVNNTFKLVLKSYWNLHENGIQAELLDELVLDPVRICTASVTLVDECDTGNMVSLHLAVYSD